MTNNPTACAPNPDRLTPRGVLASIPTRQDKTRQDKTRQDKTRQDKTRQDKTRQDKTRQDKTRQDKTRYGIKEWSRNGDLTTGGVKSGGLARCCLLTGDLAKGFELVQIHIHQYMKRKQRVNTFFLNASKSTRHFPKRCHKNSFKQL